MSVTECRKAMMSANDRTDRGKAKLGVPNGLSLDKHSGFPCQTLMAGS
jgi:hypothetical protein